MTELFMKRRLAKLEERKQAETITVVVVEDKNFYGNAHLLPPEAWASDGQEVGRDKGTRSKPGGED